MTNQFKEIKENIEIPYLKLSVLFLTAICALTGIMFVVSIMDLTSLKKFSIAPLILFTIAVVSYIFRVKIFNDVYEKSVNSLKQSVLAIEGFPDDKDQQLKFVDTLISESKSEGILDITVGSLAWISTAVISYQSYITVMASNDITATSSTLSVMKKASDQGEILKNMLSKLTSYSQLESIIPTILIIIFTAIVMAILLRFMSKNRVAMIALTDLKYDILKKAR